LENILQIFDFYLPSLNMNIPIKMTKVNWHAIWNSIPELKYDRRFTGSILNEGQNPPVTTISVTIVTIPNWFTYQNVVLYCH